MVAGARCPLWAQSRGLVPVRLAVLLHDISPDGALAGHVAAALQGVAGHRFGYFAGNDIVTARHSAPRGGFRQPRFPCA